MVTYPDDSLPLVADVARIITRRAKTAGAGNAWTFDATTKLTGDQVEDHIIDAALEVYGQLGLYDELREIQQPYALRAIALLTAANIELAYWSEQGATRTGLSPYDRLMARYESMLATARNPGTDTDGDGSANASGVLMPRATFPANHGGLVGWGTEL